MESRRKTGLAGLGHHLASEIKLAGDCNNFWEECVGSDKSLTAAYSTYLNIDFAA